MADNTLMVRLTFISLSLVCIALISSFIYFSESRLLLALIVALTGYSVYSRVEYSFYITALLTPLLVRAPHVLGTANFSIAELLVLTVLAVWAAGKGVRGDVSWVHTELDQPLVFFSFFTMLSAVGPVSRFAFPVYYFESDSQLYPIKVLADTFVVVILYFFVTNTFRKRFLRGTVAALLAGLMLASAIGLVQYGALAGNDLSARLSGENDVSMVSSTLDHKNFFGMYLILLLPLALYLAAYNTGAARTLLYAVVLLSFSALVASHSRGALVGLIGSLVVMTWFSRGRLLVYSVIFAIIFAGFIAYMTYVGDLSFSRIDQNIREGLDRRIDCWEKTLHVSAKSPLGIGAGTFREKRICSYGDQWWSMTFHHAHNLYLQILAERGWLALGALLTTFGIILERVYLGRRIDEYSDRIVWGLGTGFLAVLIYGLFDYPFYSTRISILLFFVAGIIMTESGRGGRVNAE